MKTYIIMSIALTCMVQAFVAGTARAQPNAPGAICLLPGNAGWCWAETTGTSGSACVCYTSSGPVRGTYQ